MSATGRSAERAQADYYPTPEWVVHRFLDRAKDFVPGYDINKLGSWWLEPSAGDGAIIKAVKSWLAKNDVEDKIRWTAYELREEERANLELQAESVLIGDVTHPDHPFNYVEDLFDFCIGNPPFSLAAHFFEKARQSSRAGAMLMRTDMLSSEARYPMWRKQTPGLFVLPNRPSFKGDGGTDSCDYSWFTWGDGSPLAWGGSWNGCIEILEPTPLEERKASMEKPKLVDPVGVTKELF